MTEVTFPQTMLYKPGFGNTSQGRTGVGFPSSTGWHFAKKIFSPVTVSLVTGFLQQPQVFYCCHSKWFNIPSYPATTLMTTNPKELKARIQRDFVHSCL